jgi:peptide/nickel transport system substrate-binding protein
MNELTTPYWQRWSERRRTRRGFLVGGSAATLGAAALGLVGCGDDDDGDDGAGGAQTTATAGATSTVPAPVRGGIWKRGASNAPNFIRMPLNTAGNNTVINQNGGLFNRLLRVGGSELVSEAGYDRLSRMANQDFNVVGDLATEWEVNGDGTEYTFKLDDGITWHSGRAFTADDVVFTYEAIKDPGVGGGGSPLNLMAPNLGRIEAVDEKTVSISLTKPTGYFFTLAAQTNIADRETIDQVENGVLIGTGPFKFDNYDPNRGWDLIPHEGYHRGLPLLDKVQYTIFADDAAIGTALEARDINTGGTGTPEIQDRLLASKDHYGIIATGQGGRVIRLRADIEPTRDKRVRQGIMLLIDSPRITKEFAGKFDVPGRLPWQPSSAAFDPELDQPVYDPQKARELFEAAGFIGGKLKADILPERLDAPALAQLLQQELRAFDVELEINPREYSELITLQTTGTFEHMILGFGNWVKPGDPAVTVLFADAYDGRMNALADEAVPLRERPGLKDELEWLDMIEAAKDGTWTDWRAWNEKFLDVAWSNVLFRQYTAVFHTNNVQAAFDAEGYQYIESVSVAG